MPDPNELGERMRARRRQLGLTLAEVAKASGLSIAYVSNLERGHGNPTLQAIEAIASAIDLPIGALTAAEQEPFDALQIALANAPGSLVAFSRTKRFREAVERLATLQAEPPDVMRQRLLLAMATAPRRSSGEVQEDDWRRLLDVFSLILQE
jgi:transcriptional regulator with XRE-family HTH domain